MVGSNEKANPIPLLSNKRLAASANSKDVILGFAALSDFICSTSADFRTSNGFILARCAKQWVDMLQTARKIKMVSIIVFLIDLFRK